jgi:hypothetical protein
MSKNHTTEGSRAAASSAERAEWPLSGGAEVREPVGATASRFGPRTQSGERAYEPRSSSGKDDSRKPRVSSRSGLEAVVSVAGESAPH